MDRAAFLRRVGLVVATTAIAPTRLLRPPPSPLDQLARDLAAFVNPTEAAALGMITQALHGESGHLSALVECAALTSSRLQS